MFWAIFDKFRGIVCLFLAVFVVGTVAYSSQSQHLQRDTDDKEITIEHRFSVLETKVDGLINDIQDLKYLKFIELLAMSGLIGEAGIRLVKRKSV